MSKKSDNEALIAAGIVGLLGLGLAAVLSSGKDERAAFSERLAEDLAAFGYSVVKSELGRSPANAPVWNVTLQHPYRGVMTLTAEFPHGTAPYAIATAANLAQRIAAYLQGVG